jgi:hypothetical protein
VACARCHDHKYDPIPTRDYYSLAAAYQGAAMTDIPLAPDEVVARFAAWEKELKAQEAALAQWLQDRARGLGKTALENVSGYLLTAYRVRALRARKAPFDEDALARQEGLRPVFLKRLLKHLETPQATAEVKAWQAAADKAVAEAKLSDGTVIVPDDLRKATDALQATVAAALAKKPAPNTPDPLLQALWTNPGAPFFVDVKAVAALLEGADRTEHEERKGRLEQHRKAPPPAPPLSHGVRGGGQAMRVHIRGRVDNLGEDAPPGFLRILRPADAAPGQHFTRLDLADAIATPRNPLTARVFVNRVWQHHFGRGIVATPNNFGQLGDRPTHPELLDALAVRFVEAGWSVKWLHREIMLSAAYQLGSDSAPANAAKDPDNRFLWRMSPHRLDVEGWRDALLAVSGRLDRTLGGPSLGLTDPKNVRRTIYALVSRSVPDPTLTAFDFPDANVTSDRRSVTTVPQQQLFVLNSAFMIETARAFAARLEKATPDDGQRIELAFRLAFGRSPTTAEKAIGREFLKAAAAARSPQDKLTPWEQYAQALLATNELAWVE